MLIFPRMLILPRTTLPIPDGNGYLSLSLFLIVAIYVHHWPSSGTYVYYTHVPESLPVQKLVTPWFFAITRIKSHANSWNLDTGYFSTWPNLWKINQVATPHTKGTCHRVVMHCCRRFWWEEDPLVLVVAMATNTLSMDSVSGILFPVASENTLRPYEKYP